MKTKTKLIILFVITFIYILWSVYIFVVLPNKVYTVNKNIVSTFYKDYYPKIKKNSKQIENTFWWFTFSFNVEDNSKIWLIESFFIKKNLSILYK